MWREAEREQTRLIFIISACCSSGSRQSDNLPARRHVPAHFGPDARANVSHECQRYRRGSVIGNRRGLDWRRNGAEQRVSWPENVGYRCRIHHNPEVPLCYHSRAYIALFPCNRTSPFCANTTPLTAGLILDCCYLGKRLIQSQDACP